MRRIAETLLLALLVACGGTAARAQDAAPQALPELIVDVDVNDEVWLRDHKLTEADVRTLVAQLKQNGCQTLLVRCGCLGLLPYRTELSYPLGFDEHDARAKAAPFLGDLESYIRQRTAWNKGYAEVIRDFNPPAVFIRAAHEQGLQVLAWLDLFDDGFPGFRSKFLDEHPHCQWVGRDGKTYFQGLTDYAWPEARAFRVAQARELLELGADGIHCSTSSHCRHMPNTREEDFYGYGQPVVEAYLFSEWLPSEPPELERRLRFWADVTRKNGFDGIDMHEAWNFEGQPANMALLGSMAERLRGKTPSP